MIKPHKNRPDLSWAASVFAEKGAVLLADTYVNNATKMPYICACGEQHEMTLANFRRGRKCPSCANRRVWNLAKVREYVEAQGCKLLEGTYEGMNKPMRFVCSCGSASQTSFGNFFHKGVRCLPCGINKLAGESAYQWKPEKTDEERTKGRKFREYRAWRTAVFERDNFTCHKCDGRGGVLNAHHLDDWENHPEKRLKVSNGVTLCKPCHDQFHNLFGRRTKTTAAQFREFMEA